MKPFGRIFVMLAFALTTLGALAAPSKAKNYASPEEAFAALIAALKAGKQAETIAVLGPAATPLIASGDKVADREGRARFLKAYEEANKIEKPDDAKAVLSVGKDAWPFPIPAVKDAAGWHFDAKAGAEEILNRRIGRNELYTIQAMLAFGDAERDYYRLNPQKAKLSQYAQKFASSPGKRDGLYYPIKAGEPKSPLGPRYEAAVQEGYKSSGSDAPAAYHGYKYRILKAQGPDAPGGAFDYVVRGAMIGGYALIAWPATYGNSGVMTFMVNQEGVVYQKDLGPGTDEAARKITRYNPDNSWKKVAEPGKK
jgi:hypothetical protein